MLLNLTKTALNGTLGIVTSEYTSGERVGVRTLPVDRTKVQVTYTISIKQANLAQVTLADIDAKLTECGDAAIAADGDPTLWVQVDWHEEIKNTFGSTGASQ